jgi:hypothetical protein
LERRVGVQRRQSPVSSSDVDHYLDYLGEIGWPEESLGFYETYLPDMPLPELKPVWDCPIVEGNGGVWLQRMPSDETDEITWDVFDASGALLGAIAVPRNITLYQVTSQFAVGVLRDDFDRQSVVVFEWTFSRHR